MNPLPEAKKIWDDPWDMLGMWDTDPNKLRKEQIIANIVGKVDTVVDLGCAVGRYADVLSYNNYTGYDTSSEMIKYSAMRQKSNSDFACVDICNFQSDGKYDVGLLIDVAYHHDDPISFVERIISLWDVDKLYFTLLIGNERQDLFNSTVVSWTDFLQLTDDHTIKIEYIERTYPNNYAWVVCKL